MMPMNCPREERWYPGDERKFLVSEFISGSIVSLLCVAALNADGTMAVRGRVGSGRRWKE